MDSFEAELMRRSPLAACVLEMSDFVFEDALMESIWGEHRGRCYQDVLKFPDLLRLMRDALVNHGGSAHRLFVSLERRAAQPVEESNFYRKLSRTPVEISRALLRQCTARLAGLMPPGAAGAAGAAGGAGAALPACLDGFTAIAADGKKIKNAAKRLAPTRGFSGKPAGGQGAGGAGPAERAGGGDERLAGRDDQRRAAGRGAPGAVAQDGPRADPLGVGPAVRRRGDAAASVGAGGGRVRGAGQAVARPLRRGIDGTDDRRAGATGDRRHGRAACREGE